MRAVRTLAAALTAVVLFAYSFGAWAAEEPILIRFAHVVSDETPKGAGALRFKELVEERLDGRVRVEVYPLSRRVNDDEALLALLFGDIELAAPSLAKFKAYTPQLQVFDLPFLFDDMDHVERFYETDAGQALLSSMEDRGLKGLAFWSNGPRVISADRSVRTPDDVEGVRFRIEPSAVFHDQWTRATAVPIPMPFGRVADALRDGIVDGQENAWSNIRSRELARYTPHFLELDHSFLNYMVVSSAEFWDGLPDDIRGSLEAILAEVSAEVNEDAREHAAADRAAVLAEQGIEVVTPSEAERQAWQEVFAPVRATFDAEVGVELLQAVEEARR